jgi:hypothetical protein
MIPITSLWLPILVAAVLVFVASSVIHMLLTYHRNDFRAVPNEDAVMDALRPFTIPPGDYVLPHAGSMEVMKSDAYREKVRTGPILFFTSLAPGRVFEMGGTLVQWFLYSVLVGIIAAYLAGRMLPPGAPYLEVFRVTGTVTFACYSMALMQRSIWYHMKWSATLRSMFDGLIYALLTAGAFGWLWPS